MTLDEKAAEVAKSISKDLLGDEFAERTVVSMSLVEFTAALAVAFKEGTMHADNNNNSFHLTP